MKIIWGGMRRESRMKEKFFLNVYLTLEIYFPVFGCERRIVLWKCVCLKVEGIFHVFRQKFQSCFSIHAMWVELTWKMNGNEKWKDEKWMTSCSAHPISLGWCLEMWNGIFWVVYPSDFNAAPILGAGLCESLLRLMRRKSQAKMSKPKLLLGMLLLVGHIFQS